VSVPDPCDHPDWLFELKYDGFRGMAYIRNGKAELISRKGNAYQSFEPLRAHLGTVGHDVILDGEITLLDGDGRPQFNDLLRRRGEPIFYAFDCLWLDGRDLPQSADGGMPLVQGECAARLRLLDTCGERAAQLARVVQTFSPAEGQDSIKLADYPD
jgi:hypothetical protein